MPRIVPASIQALASQENTRAPVWLMKWELASGTRYYSSGEQVNWGGQTWLGNRIKSLPSFEAGLIDRKNRNFARLEIELDNLADDGSANFHFTAIVAAEVVEDRKVTLYAYSPDANDAVLMWWGFSGRPEFDGDNKTAKLTASFFFDTFDLKVPTKHVQQFGFMPTESSGRTNEADDEEEFFVPLVYCAGSSKVSPVVYNHWADGATLHVNFILSGIHSGLPFSANDVQASDVKLFNVTPATTVEFYPGNQATPPANLTRFPDGQAHTNVAFGYAAFSITNEIKDKLDDIKSNNIKVVIANGRPLVDTGIPSENPALIVKDFLRDPLFSVGLPNSLFDATALATTSAYVGTRYQCRYEFREPQPLTEFVQQILGDFHGYLTFENGLIQVNCKRNNETSIATLVTADSGFSGIKIDGDAIPLAKEKDSSELINKVVRKFRRKKRQRRIVIVQDTAAQNRAGGTAAKPVPEEVDKWDIGGLYDEEQNKIVGAIAVREDQNGNLFCSCKAPFWSVLRIAPGDIITLRSVDIFNNVSNRDFRVTKETIEADSESDYLIGFECQIYKQAIYNDDYLGLGVDLLRLGEDSSVQGRPSDVIPVSLQIVPTGTNDTDGKLLDILCTCTIPAFDPTAEQADGLFREPPIAAWQPMWNFTDESPNLAREGTIIEVRQGATAFQSTAIIHVDCRKSKSVQVWFVALGANRARASLGYIPDPTKVFIIRDNPFFSATDVNLDLNSVAGAQVNDYIIIEKEIDKIVGIIGAPTNVLVLASSGGNRTPQFDTQAIAHPFGTQVAIAKLSYPVLSISLAGSRFGYQTVTARDVLPRGGDGQVVRWFDANAENEEEYLVYFSTDGDAGTNINKLGSSSPAWYFTDPLNPPASVKLLTTNRQKHLRIHEEDLGPIGTPLFARIAARNGKRNFSSALSGLLNGNVVGGGTAPPTDAPSTPAASLVVFNQPTVGTTGEADVVLKVFASQANNALTFQATNTTAIIVVFTDPKGKEHHKHFLIKDQTATFVEIPRSWTLGGLYTWTANIAVAGGGGKLSSATAAIQIAAGGFGLAASGITGLQINSITPINQQHSYVNYQYTQPATPVLLAFEQVLVKLAGEASFSEGKHRDVMGDASRLIAGLIQAKLKIEHPKNNALQAQIKLVSADGSSITSTAFNNTSQDDDTAAPNNGVAITIKRAKLKKGGKLLINYELPTVQMASYDKSVLIIHDNNSTGTGRKFYDPFTSAWVTTYPDGTTEISLARGMVEGLHIAPSEIFVGGRTQCFIRIGVYNRFNGGTATYSADLGTPITQAGSEADSVSQDTVAPDLLPTPTLKFKRGKLRAKMNMATVTNVQTLKDRVELCVFDGTNSLNLDDPTSESIVAGIVFYQVGVADKTLPFDLDQLKRIFGPGANLRCRFKLTNDIAPTTSSDSGLLALSSQRDMTTLYNGTNLLRNGHLVMNDGTVAKHWQTYNPATGNFGTLDQTGKLRLDKNEHRMKWRDTNNQNDQRFALQNLGKVFFKNEFFGFSWNIYSNGTPTIDEFVIGLFTQKTLTNTISGSAGDNKTNGSGFLTDLMKVGAVLGNGNEWRTVVNVTSGQLTMDRNWNSNFSGANGFALIPQAMRLSQTNLALTTADKFQKATAQTDSDLDTSRDIYFVVLLRDVVDTTTFPFVDALCMNSGQESAGYQRSVASFETNFAGTGESFDSQPTGGSSSGGAQPPGGGSGAPGTILPILN